MSKISSSAAAPRNASHHTNGTRSTSGSTADVSGLSETLQGHVDDIRTLLQCGICIRPLYEPFTLACGHTFCYSCLTSWFSGGRSNRTCPDCRAAVKSQPAPAYLIRTLVQLFTGRAELLDKGETTAEHASHQREEAERVETDKNNPNPAQAGLFGGTFNKDRGVARPIVDLEDNVMRCPQCSWELDEGNDCTQCGYRLDEDSLSDSMDYDTEEMDEFEAGYEDAFAEMDEWQNFAEAFPGIDMEALGIPRFGGFGIRGRPHHHFPALDDRPRDNMIELYSEGSVSRGTDESDSEDEDDTEMDSFIDDDELRENDFSESDRSTVVGAHDYGPANGRDRNHRRDYSPHPFSSDISNVSATPQLLSPTPQPFSSDIASVTVSGTDEDEEGSSEEGSSVEGSSDEDDDEEEPVRPAVVASRHRRPIAAPDRSAGRRGVMQTARPTYHTGRRPSRPSHPSRSHSSSTRRHERSRPEQNISRGTSVSTAINVDDESDEGPVGPMRRTRDRGSRRQRAY